MQDEKNNFSRRHLQHKTAEKTIFMSLIDGEHINIKYDKTRKFINLYAAFDIYFVGNKNVRSKSFIYVF